MSEPNLDWVTVMSIDEFRDTANRFDSGQLKKLRDDFVSKLRSLNEQILIPQSQKTNRYGDPVTPEEYEEWLAKIEKARRLTERQLEIVNSRILDVGFIGGMATSQVLRGLLDIIDRDGPRDESDDNLIRIVEHYVNRQGA
jgi:hypothetical protein